MKPITITLTADQAQAIFELHLANLREMQARPQAAAIVLRSDFMKMITSWPGDEVRGRKEMERIIGHKINNNSWYPWLKEATEKGLITKVSTKYWRKVNSVDEATVALQKLVAGGSSND